MILSNVDEDNRELKLAGREAYDNKNVQIKKNYDNYNRYPQKFSE